MQVATQVVTMSSREIAELVGTTHDSVLKTVRSLIEQGVVFGNETPYVHPQNRQTYSEFHLSFRDTMIIVSGYSVKMRARIIDRWQELETAVTTPVIDLNDPTFLRNLLIDYTGQNIALKAQIAEQEPKVNALRRIAEAEGSFCISDAAKMLQMPPRQLFTRLNEMRWIFKRPGCAVWLGYQDKTQAGLLVHKSTLVTREDGTEKVAEQVRITGRGIARVATLLGAAVVEVEEATA